jgi:hypothetical protein
METPSTTRPTRQEFELALMRATLSIPGTSEEFADVLTRLFSGRGSDEPTREAFELSFLRTSSGVQGASEEFEQILQALFA